MTDLPQDTATELAHRLIRSQAGDGLDPFMIHGHPFMPQTEKKVVRACFYYALTVGPKITVLFDNQGRGGMCDMTADEVSAIWKTPELLAALGTTFEALRDGTATLADVAPPAPAWTWDAVLGEAKKAA